MSKGILDNFESDFGFESPHRTKSKCFKPVFADHHLHRIATMKDYHIGSKGDVDENGIAGWITKRICTGCGKQFKGGYFIPDKKKNQPQEDRRNSA